MAVLPGELQTQPKTFKLSLKSFLSLPYRVCNPPPAVGKVRSCGVTPVFKIKLEDVLDRKHLPPLGLKDFEEWLLYVEQCPENLYFILWLREYRLKYNQWATERKPLRSDTGEYRVAWPVQSSSHLAMFYARAKQTFFTPNSNYELNVPSDILSPFHTSTDFSPHPDPAIFKEVECEIQNMLKESLDRFVLAAYNNVGNNRVLCGLVGGWFIGCACGLIPLIYGILHWDSRWLRMAALPGLWLGLTILVSSLNGVCLMIWTAGDVRQLRKFELSRPPISRPKPLPAHLQRPVVPGPILPLTHPPRLSVVAPPPAHVSRRTRSISSSSDNTFSSSSSSSGGNCEIYISPAYYDEEPIEGPTVTHDANYSFPSKHPEPFEQSGATADSFAPTASFIHPFIYSNDDDDDDNYPHNLARQRSPEDVQPMSAFDFDALPPRPFASRRSYVMPRASTLTPLQSSIITIEPDAPEGKVSYTFKGVLAYLQSKCNIHKWRVGSVAAPGDSEKGEHSHPNDTSDHVRWRLPDTEAKVRTQFKLMQAVPTFASPLTRILSPVVQRAQWEIICRSAVAGLVLSWVILGSSLAVPLVMH